MYVKIVVPAVLYICLICAYVYVSEELEVLYEFLILGFDSAMFSVCWLRVRFYLQEVIYLITYVL